MKIADAKPGDVLRDPMGAVWLRTRGGARLLIADDDDIDGRELCAGDVLDFEPTDGTTAAEQFGPFTRLVPESLRGREPRPGCGL